MFLSFFNVFSLNLNFEYKLNLFFYLFSGEEVEWVQCDKCENWYHIICVGISSEEASAVDEYICPDCKPVSKKRKDNDYAAAVMSPLVSDLSVMAHVATQMINEQDMNSGSKIVIYNDPCKQIIKNDLNSLICLADVSEKMDAANVHNEKMDPDKSSISPSSYNRDEKYHSSSLQQPVMKELYEPVVPTWSTEKSS